MDNEKEENKEVTVKKTGFKQSVWEFIKFVIIAVIIVVPIRLWVAQPFIVSGSSMVPNFENGEYLIVDEFSYHFREPQRGEVIIFRFPQDPSRFFIKRIIGLPGEKVEMKNDNIHIYNEEFPEGMTIEESYLADDLKTGNGLIMILDENEYFVLGDNRSMSSDSRIWGSLDKDLVIGRAWIRLWPFNKISISF
ncbi:signal peptidase I [Patescibacteria group bacterium]|nr:signal peptidase I [Patescibacteria group bacterium]MBU2633256.1 signal peptidase I [Patescibacteria group bacterium]